MENKLQMVQVTNKERRQFTHTLTDEQIARLKILAIANRQTLTELVTDALAKLAEQGE